MSKKDVIDNFVTISATLAVVLQALLAVLLLLAFVSLFSKRARRLLVGLRDTFAGSELWIAWVIALAAVAGSLFLSEYASFIPCRLCWFQRVAMYPLVILLLVGAVRRDRGAVYYAITFPIAGLLVGGYHKYIEIHPEAELAGCKIGAPCSTNWLNNTGHTFGYVTIPVLAMSAFAAILTLLLFAWSSARAQAREDAAEGLRDDVGAPPPLPPAEPSETPSQP